MSKEAVKLFIKKMTEDEGFADKVIACKDKEERLKFAQGEGFDFTAEEFNEMSRNGEIDIDHMLAHLARAYEGQGIRIFVRSGVGLFE